jgi:hypothetical protein
MVFLTVLIDDRRIRSRFIMDAVVFKTKFSSTVIRAPSSTTPKILGYFSPSFRKLLHMHSQILPTASNSTSALDPDWIRIQLGQRIWIQIGILIRAGSRQAKFVPPPPKKKMKKDEISCLKSLNVLFRCLKKTYR